ncbi:MAG: hypothetical protein QXI58_02250 [Candidatus Micrarchaeia archaeon]
MKEAIERLKKRREILKKDIASVTEQIVTKKEYVSVLKEIKKIFTKAIEIGEVSAKDFLEKTVSEGINLIYGRKLQFKIEKVMTGGRYGLVFKIGDNNHFRSLLCYGGGLRSIVSTILRFVIANCLLPDCFFVFDEVGSNLSKEYQSKFGLLLRSFSEKFDRQVILITHQPKVSDHSHKIIEVSLDQDKSVVYEKRVSF